MPGSTSNFGWAYPLDTDPLADGAQEIQNFADAADTDLAGLLGGTTGQALVKDSATDLDFSWQTVSAKVFAVPYQSAKYYPPVIDGSGNITANSGRAWYLPIFVGETSTFDRIACQTSSAHTGTSSVRLGIYNMGAGVPTTLVLDAGTVSATAASTLYSITINQTLNQGWYWLVGVVQSSTGTRGFLGASDPLGSASLEIIPGINRASTTSIAGALRPYLYQDSVSGGLPATATPLESAFMTTCILVSLRKS